MLEKADQNCSSDGGCVNIEAFRDVCADLLSDLLYAAGSALVRYGGVLGAGSRLREVVICESVRTQY